MELGDARRIWRRRSTGRSAMRFLVGATAVMLLVVGSVGTALAYTGDDYNPTPNYGNKWCYKLSDGSISCRDAPETYAFSGSWPAALKQAVIDQVEYMDTSGHRRANTPKLTQTTSTTTATILFKYGGSDPCGTYALACAHDDRSGVDAEDQAGGNYTIYFRVDDRKFVNTDGSVWYLRWCELNSNASGCFDGRNVTLHEMGHFLGLDHWVPSGLGPGKSITVMQSQNRANTSSQPGWDAIDCGACDDAMLQLKYDLDLYADRYSVCLARQKTAFSGFAASDTSIPYHGSETFSVTFKVADDASGSGNESIFENNPIESHEVKLQRSTDGFATYSEYAMVSEGSGKYTYTFSSLSFTASFRVVYTTPSNEGLTGASTSAIKVTFAPCNVAPCPQ